MQEVLKPVFTRCSTVADIGDTGQQICHVLLRQVMDRGDMEIIRTLPPKFRRIVRTHQSFTLCRHDSIPRMKKMMPF